MTARNSLIGLAGPEFECLFLAASVGFGPAEIARIKSLIDAGIDWPAFLAGVERNYVAPVVHRNLKSIESLNIPSKVLGTLRVRSKISAFKSELFATELVRLTQVFELKAIETINYKGVVTAEEFYGAAALRNFNDLDFLVRREQAPAMFEVLEAEGYCNSEKLTPKEFDHYLVEFKEFLFTRGEFLLEPHWSIAGRRYPFDTDYEGFWRRSRLLNFRGVDLRVMSPEDSLLVLCFVGAKGRWQRLQMITDVAACLRTYPNLDWAAVEAMAAATGTVRILHLGLLLAAELAGARLPQHLEGQVRKTAVVRKLSQTVVKALAVAPAPRRFLPDTPSIFSPQLFRQREKFRDRWLYFWRTTTTPEPLHMRRLPLPKAGFLLYKLFVPLHDLVMYPAVQLLKTAVRRCRPG